VPPPSEELVLIRMLRDPTDTVPLADIAASSPLDMVTVRAKGRAGSLTVTVWPLASRNYTLSSTPSPVALAE
jgi:hypothetical protein